MGGTEDQLQYATIHRAFLSIIEYVALRFFPQHNYLSHVRLFAEIYDLFAEKVYPLDLLSTGKDEIITKLSIQEDFVLQKMFLNNELSVD